MLSNESELNRASQLAALNGKLVSQREQCQSQCGMGMGIIDDAGAFDLADKTLQTTCIYIAFDNTLHKCGIKLFPIVSWRNLYK